MLLALLLLTGLLTQEPADLVLHSGQVVTVDAARPAAQAVAVRGGRIVFVGSSAEALVLAGEGTRVIDLAGRAVYPGFTDAHGHLPGYALSLVQVDLVGSSSYEEVIVRIAARARELPKGAWVTGRGWDQNDWPDTAMPHHRALSDAVPDHPVAVTRIDGHALLANAAALRAAGLDRTTADPDGGRILRGPEGEPAGVLVDGAMSLVRRAVPPPPEAELRAGTKLAIQRLHRLGVTGVHDAGVDSATIELFAAMARAGEFDLRDYIMLAGSPRTLDEWLPRGPQDDLTGTGRISVRAIKLSADGALGSRGAALLADYADEPGNRGLVTTGGAVVEQVAARALASGFQLCVHAIGDRGNRIVLDAFERALAAHPGVDHRFRVEHAQVLHADDIPRFAALGVIPSMQAQHQTSDMYWAGERLGPERVLGAYAWRALLETGVVIPGGSDFPVEEPDPIAAYRAAVARQDAAGWPAGGWYPTQRMSRAEGLRHLTIWPAYAAFAEGRLGSITPGKLADLVVLSRELRTTPVAELGAVRVEMTIFDGRVVYEAAK